jgi:hypothetical protein
MARIKVQASVIIDYEELNTHEKAIMIPYLIAELQKALTKSLMEELNKDFEGIMRGYQIGRDLKSLFPKNDEENKNDYHTR